MTVWDPGQFPATSLYSPNKLLGAQGCDAQREPPCSSHRGLGAARGWGCCPWRVKVAGAMGGGRKQAEGEENQEAGLAFPSASLTELPASPARQCPLNLPSIGWLYRPHGGPFLSACLLSPPRAVGPNP